MGKPRTNTARWDKKNERWRITVQKDGIRKQFYSSTVGRTGQREANAKADRWLEDGIEAKPKRVEAVYADWLEDLKLTTSTSNWQPIESRWRLYILPEIGSRRVDAVTDGQLQKIIDKQHAAGRSKKTLQNMNSDFGSFFKYCRKNKMCTYRPEDIAIPAGARYKGKSTLQPDELKTLLTVDTTLYKGKRVHDEYINAYRFQVLMGLRPGELIALRWDDIHGDTVHICRSLNTRGELTQGKNENAVRSFVMPDMARAVLEQQRKETGCLPTVFGVKREDALYRRWKAYCQANGIRPISLYELRHTFVSVVKNLPEGEIKSLVGHSKNMDTFGQYSHALKGDAEHTAEAVNGIFLRLLNIG